MQLSTELSTRSESTCELCGGTSFLSAYTVPPKSGTLTDHQVVVCETCLGQLENQDQLDPIHWRCLNESIWSLTPAVQVVSLRLLRKLTDQAWAQDTLGMIDPDIMVVEWADDTDTGVVDEVHKDANGQVLQQGDTVVLIHDLNVKGANFTAKRGTAVRRITLVNGNPEQIEGRVNDQNIVILTKYVKKSG